eukprot:TRINITY_DN24207_c0_g1_i1.p1 TRINITY_DN24207_c0_g1~~TRINITY_DN24207_c0_g1_i1.p1  ORF type:complete len:387 (+),score=80.17 TRINITY_DN24207_c0_g1_i1:59-1219(+)
MMQHSVMPLCEPPPLLAASEYNRTPLEALNVNGNSMDKNAKKMAQKKELHGMLNATLQELANKGKYWDVSVGALEGRLMGLMQHSRCEKEILDKKVLELGRKVKCISEAVEHSIILIPMLNNAVGLLLQAQASSLTEDHEKTAELAAAAKQILERQNTVVAYGQTIPVTPDMTTCLNNAGRSDVLNQVVFSPVNALHANACMLLGAAKVKLQRWTEASDVLLVAMKLLKMEVGPNHGVTVECADLSHHAESMKLEAGGDANDTAPTTPRSSSRRTQQYFFTPPPARSTIDLEGDFTRGAVTPGTGPNWETPYFSFTKNWTQNTDKTPSPQSRRRVKKECYNCGSTANLKLCSKCKQVCFCSVSCQATAWETRHAEECVDHDKQRPM